MMNRKIIMNLAMSIDGFIADENGGFDWIVGDGNNRLNTEKQWDYNKFLDRIDTVVMGKNCYDQKFYEEFKEKTVLSLLLNLWMIMKILILLMVISAKLFLMKRKRRAKIFSYLAVEFL